VALAAEIEESASAIKRHVERELARARLAPSLFKRAESRPDTIVGDVVGGVRRTPHGERRAVNVKVAPEMTVPVHENDPAEILGNLSENAARFAAATVSIEVARSEAGTVISVADDGPGLPEAEQQSALLRGTTTKDDGSGLGLAIVSDIVAA